MLKGPSLVGWSVGGPKRVVPSRKKYVKNEDLFGECFHNYEIGVRRLVLACKRNVQA